MRFNIFNSNKTRNHEGAPAFRMSTEMELYTAVVTAGLSNTFYEGANDRLERIRTLIRKCDPDFVSKLAVYTREQMHMRSVPLVLAVELAKATQGNGVVKATVGRVVQRADEITELLAYYQLANERSETKKLDRLSKQVQKGLGMAFNKFDEYQFAKYNRKTEVTLKDALFLTHPKAKDAEQQALFNKIVKDELEVPYTWEVELSKLGQQVFATESEKMKAFRNKWQELIESKKLGYMALMRNLRNILQAEVSKDHLKMVAKRLGDYKEVRRSKQLPIRFLSAYKELEEMANGKAGLLMKALEKAVKVSAENIKGFDEDTRVLIASDVSGSMWQPLSSRSKVQLYDVGLMLSMLLQNRCGQVVTGLFGDTWKVINLPQENILGNVQHLRSREGEVGYSTNAYKVIESLIQKRVVMDKLMFFTDLQLWNSKAWGSTTNDFQELWKRYKREVAPDAKLYLFDLAGYGQSPLEVHKDDVHLIAGWSDKVFDILQALEDGKSALKVIKQLEV